MNPKKLKKSKKGLCRAKHTLYYTYFPKSDPSLVHDLLRRSQKNPDITSIYMVEVFTKPGVNPEAAKKYIFEKTGMVPAIYDNGTLFVTNQRLTLEMLKEISDSDDVLEVAGDWSVYHANVAQRNLNQGSKTLVRRHSNISICELRFSTFSFVYHDGFPS